ncbi:MAG TPA: YggT family protein [Candidatus Omnitrophota bacterium]|nr:YggT family protein [Candidatus Omnitrophota bacterium]HPD84210.1 YggT family protein [Candidatus Omnitrophota bacterium]HRZ03066.1 YggT family protein [Candidatus Omnitrophota bacterium]
MFIVGNLLLALARVVDVLLIMFYWLILIRALISWVNPDPYNTIVQFLYRVTEPILQPIRRILPPMGIDISPIIAFLIIVFLQSFLVRTLTELSFKLRYE